MGKKLTHRARVTPEVLEEMFAAIEQGITLRAFCSRPGMPTRAGIYKVIRADVLLQERFAAARRDGFDALAEEALEIADAPVKSKHAVQDKRVRIDARLRLLAKWDSGRYGDKLQLGGDGGSPIQLSNRELADGVSRILALGMSRKLAAERNASSNGHDEGE